MPLRRPGRPGPPRKPGDSPAPPPAAGVPGPQRLFGIPIRDKRVLSALGGTLVVLILVAGAVGRALSKPKPAQPLNPFEYTKPPRLQTVDGLMKDRPAEAAALCREILAAPESEGERKDAQARLARALYGVYQAAKKDSRFEDLELIQQEVADKCQGTPFRNSVFEEWAADLPKWAARQAALGHADLAKRLFERAMADPLALDRGQAVYEYQQWMLAETSKAPNPARADVLREETMRVIQLPMGVNRVAAALDRDLSDEELRSRAEKSLKDGRAGAALHLAAAALRTPHSLPAEGRKALEDLRVRATLAAVEAMAAGRLVVAPESSWQELYEELVNAPAETRRAIAAAVLKARLARAQAYEKTGNLERAMEVLDRAAYRTLDALWKAHAEQAAVDPWAGATPEVLTWVEGRAKGPGEGPRLQALNEAYGRRIAWPPIPESAPARAACAEGRARLIRQCLETKPAAAANHIRAFVRESPSGQTRASLAPSLEGVLRKAAGSSDFVNLVGLTSVYLDEFDVDGKSPFRGELLGLLEAACEAERARAPMKRLFLLSIVADEWSAEERGRAAEKEILGSGMDMVFRMAGGDSMAAAEEQGPSDLPDRSASFIQNSTGFHILVLFSGPERFMVRLGPWQKGFAVLKNGSYSVGVLAASEDIRPFKGAGTWKDSITLSDYVIAKGNESGWGLQLPGGAFGWNFLRAPAGDPRYVHDPVSGGVRILEK
ncbi:MAG: hypothetical protein HYY18_12885 [Planctomycetes bacterium]|nr:hypothetical protein [Planctomycetota bacterium]